MESEVAQATGPAKSGEVEDYVLMSLGNQVWFDDGNGNPTFAYDGLFNNGETTVADVTVTLVVSNTGATVATTTTNASGKYLFTGLTPGDYRVVVDAQNFQTGGPLETYVSTFTQEPNANLDVDNNDNGIDTSTPAVNGVSSSGVTLSLGGEPPASTDTNGTTPT